MLSLWSLQIPLNTRGQEDRSNRARSTSHWSRSRSAPRSSDTWRNWCSNGLSCDPRGQERTWKYQSWVWWHWCASHPFSSPSLRNNWPVTNSKLADGVILLTKSGHQYQWRHREALQNHAKPPCCACLDWCGKDYCTRLTWWYAQEHLHENTGGRRHLPPKLWSAPPTMAAFRPHCRRASYLTALWMGAGSPNPPNFGRTRKSSSLQPIYLHNDHPVTPLERSSEHHQEWL